MGKKKLALLGSGKLNTIVAQAWKNGLLEDYDLVGIYGRNPDTCRPLAKQMGCIACESLDELLKLRPDYVAEAASVEAVRSSAEKILRAGSNFVVLSIGAFADRAFYEKIRATAAECETRVHIASGAVGGFDVLRTISLMGSIQAEMNSHKGPNSLHNTPLFDEKLRSEETKVFSGSAQDAIGLLPTKVNVAVANALVTSGPENLKFDIYSVPGYVGDDHKLTLEGEGAKAVVDVYTASSAIAGWSVVALLRNLSAPIMF